MSILLSAVVAALTGVISAFGIGGGTLLMVYLTLCTDFSQAAAQGINLLYFLPTAGASLSGHIRNGYLRRDVMLPAAAAGMLAAVCAAFAASVVEPWLLRRLFGGGLLMAGIWSLISALRRPNVQNER